MKKAIITIGLICLILAFSSLRAQSGEISEILATYEQYKEKSLEKRRIKHFQVELLVQRLRRNSPFEIRRVGSSMLGRSINLISFGEGDIDVFLWSQMHGNEPTATQAIFDLLNYFQQNWEDEWVIRLRSKLRIHFLPMLNPDGAQLFTRRTALFVDMNRDANRLQSPEGRLLKELRDSLQAEWGFNLHDMNPYYKVGLSMKPATIAFLAPPYNYEEEVDSVRRRAMQLIGVLNRALQEVIPGQVSKWGDDYEPRAFGDNVQKWGTSTVLIESGYYPGDPERQEVRKLNYLALMVAFRSILDLGYEEMGLRDYRSLPRNDNRSFDLKIHNITHIVNGRPYQLDIGIKRFEKDDSFHDSFHIESRVEDLGDLSTHLGHETFDATGYTLIEPRYSQEAVTSGRGQQLFVLNDFELLRKGIGFIRMGNIPPGQKIIKSPMNAVRQDYEAPRFLLRPGINATFFLEKNGELTHAVINGYLLDLKRESYGNFRNALVIED